MSLELSVALIIGVLLLLMGTGLYIGFSLAAVGVLALFFVKGSSTVVSASLGNAANNYPLAAVPLFILMGEIVLHTGMSGNLYKGVSQLTRIIPGGLLHSNIVSCAIFAAVSGSSPATAATIGTVAFSEQTKRRYNPSLITGSLASGGTLGILIPPSITMIIYGAFVGASVGRLFAGGIIPGIILALMFMCYIGFAVVRDKSLAPPRERLTRRYFLEALIALKDIWPMLLIMGLIMGSIYGGIMTPTEAAAASAFLAMLLGVAFGKMNYNVIKNSALETLRTTSMIMLVFAGASILSAALGVLRIPTQIVSIIAGLELTKLLYWFGIIILYLILGCFMEPLGMMLITLPVSYPLLVTTCGFDPIWFGVQLVILCEIGMVTPPVGLNLFVIMGIAKGVSYGEIIRGIIPFVIVMLAMIALLTFVPDLILFLPAHMFK